MAPLLIKNRTTGSGIPYQIKIIARRQMEKISKFLINKNRVRYISNLLTKFKRSRPNIFHVHWQAMNIVFYWYFLFNFIPFSILNNALNLNMILDNFPSVISNKNLLILQARSILFLLRFDEHTSSARSSQGNCHCL